MLIDEIKVKRYIGHTCCDGFLTIKNDLIVFEPADFVWESLKFKFPTTELLSIQVYDIFTVSSYVNEYLSSKALNISTKTGSQYIIGCKDISKLLNILQTINSKQNSNIKKTNKEAPIFI